MNTQYCALMSPAHVHSWLMQTLALPWSAGPGDYSLTYCEVSAQSVYNSGIQCHIPGNAKTIGMSNICADITLLSIPTWCIYLHTVVLTPIRLISRVLVWYVNKASLETTSHMEAVATR